MARQKLGQHFLQSPRILERIATAVCGDATALAPVVVEVGAGKGALTAHLLQRAAAVKAIELDAELARGLEERWRNEPRLAVAVGDALAIDWHQWGPAALVGNLPYYAATAIISRFLRAPGPLGPAVFLVQKEVAERITSPPGHREYGYLSVECQYLARAEYLFTVAPGAFHPPPKVDSAVVRLTPIQPARRDFRAFLNFASACFRQKRKTLRNNLASRYPRDLLDVRPEAGLRAEQLSVAELMQLFEELSAARAQETDVAGLAPTESYNGIS